MSGVKAVNDDVCVRVSGRVGCLTLNRPKALNALSLGMIRTLTASLLAWRDDPAVLAVAIRGNSRARPAADGSPPASESVPFGAFCAGGDIRFFHQAATSGNPELEDFFTEEYALNHLIHTYAKPIVAFMDGIIMGGGMGVAQGARHRLATERTQMAMPETLIGLFPDVGGGYFLSRCPGAWGEYLGLTGEVIGGAQAQAVGLADGCVASGEQARIWQTLGERAWQSADELSAWVVEQYTPLPLPTNVPVDFMNTVFALPTVGDMLGALATEANGGAHADWAAATLATLRKQSPLMLVVVLEQIRRARTMSLADELRLERDLVRHCFYRPDGAPSETLEGVRALAVDKDRTPRWSPARVEDVDAQVVAGFFHSPWPTHAHPLSGLA